HSRHGGRGVRGSVGDRRGQLLIHMDKRRRALCKVRDAQVLERSSHYAVDGAAACPGASSGTPPGSPSEGTSEGYTSCPCSATSPISMFSVFIRSGMRRPTSFSRMNVTTPVHTITNSAAKNCHLSSVQLPWITPATPP